MRVLGPREKQTDDWLTPRRLVELLGPFQLDPCASLGQPWRTAQVQYTEEDDGLTKPWPREWLTWLNPPYENRVISYWLSKLADHGHGVALVMARVGTAWFDDIVMGRADALLTFRKRIRYCYRVSGRQASHNNGCGSTLALWGPEAIRRAERLTRLDIDDPYFGRLVPLRTPAPAAPAKPKRVRTK